MKKDIAIVLKRIIPLLSESQPQYINNFAAESFAFVARDIRDKKKFVSLVLNYLQQNDDVSICYFIEILCFAPLCSKIHENQFSDLGVKEPKTPFFFICNLGFSLHLEM